ncbi:MAG: glycosyltransferase [Lachnospiraceae bacterium]|nr:glycosyltransferase [Lachnospiraceae bacterium]
MSLRTTIRKYREKPWDQKYLKQWGFQKTYNQWLEEQVKELGNPEPEEVSVEIVLLTEGEGRLSLFAGAVINSYMASHPETMLLYGDEDVELSENVYGNPWLKPDWSPDTFLDHDYLGAVVAVRKSFYDRATAAGFQKPGLTGTEEKPGITEEGNQFFRGQTVEKNAGYPTRMELLAAAGGFAPDCRSITHLPCVLFHRKEDWQPCAKEHKPVEIPDLSGELVSIIIPSRDHYEILSRCLDSVPPTVKGIPYEIIVVDNGSGPETREKVERKLEKLLSESEASGSMLQNTSYIYEQKTFNFSNMCNTGVASAKGNLLLFLNDDAEAIEPGWLETMAVKGLSDWAGAVGAKLLYPGGDQIQHAGITNIIIGPMHKLQFLSDSGEYYDDRNHGVRNMLAVTGACLLIRSDRFREIGGFEESLRVAFNDVDICYSLYDKGYHNINCNDVRLYHHESLSRGKEESEEDQRRLTRERNILSARHPGLEGRDPYYNPGLNCRLLDTSVHPAWEDGIILKDVRNRESCQIPENARTDACLRCVFELHTTRQMQGWIVVLGSDNACFDKAVLLQPVSEPDKIYKVEYTDQYRVDLERNMPDQKNVGLSGFAFEFDQHLPAGEYRLGAIARDRLSRLCLVNWVGHTFEVGR